MTDGNIDLCRNFRDGDAHPSNPGYQKIAEFLNATPGGAAADVALAQAREALGPGYIAAVMGRQFEGPTGFSFGGHAPCWSRRTLEAVLAPFTAHTRELRVMDMHTGAGPYAVSTFVCLQSGTALAEARARFGVNLMAPMDTAAGGQPLHPAVGHPTEGYGRIFPEAKVMSVVLEMGTLPPDETLPVLIGEHRLTRHTKINIAGLRDDPLRQLLWDQHAPTDTRWRESALQHGLAAVEALLR